MFRREKRTCSIQKFEVFNPVRHAHARAEPRMSSDFTRRGGGISTASSQNSGNACEGQSPWGRASVIRKSGRRARSEFATRTPCPEAGGTGDTCDRTSILGRRSPTGLVCLSVRPRLGQHSDMVWWEARFRAASHAGSGRRDREKPGDAGYLANCRSKSNAGGHTRAHIRRHLRNA